MTWKNPELVQEALELGTHGNVIERYKILMDLQHENYVYPIELDFDLQAINDLLTRCTKYDQEAINVSLKRDGGKFTVVEEIYRSGRSDRICVGCGEIYRCGI